MSGQRQEAHGGGDELSFHSLLQSELRRRQSGRVSVVEGTTTKSLSKKLFLVCSRRLMFAGARTGASRCSCEEARFIARPLTTSESAAPRSRNCCAENRGRLKTRAAGGNSRATSFGRPTGNRLLRRSEGRPRCFWNGCSSSESPDARTGRRRFFRFTAAGTAAALRSQMRHVLIGMR